MERICVMFFVLKQHALLLLIVIAQIPAPVRADWVRAFSLRVEEGYDSSVFLQDETALGDRSSFITTIQPGVDLGWRSQPLNVDVTYQPRIAIYTDESSETNVANLMGVNFKGALGSVAYEFTNALCYVNGSRTTPIYTGPGGIPAIAAYQLRDRREQFWMKQNACITISLGSFFLRPVYCGALNDFKTAQREIPGYVNYVDRNNFNGGLDIGAKIMADTWIVAGYRAGAMSQDRLFDNSIQYNNTYQRALIGIEGSPARWLKLNAMAGPSFHHFTADVPEIFGRDETRVFADATVTLLPTARDTVQLIVSRFEQLSSCGRGAYEDIVYRASYTRKLTDALEAKADFRIYRAEFERPGLRDDTIYTPAVQLTWHQNAHLTWTAQYSYEWAESDIPDTSGREYHHHLASFGATWEL